MTISNIYEYIMKISFRYVAYSTSQFERLSNLDIKKKLAKEKTVLNFIVYFTQVETLTFPLKHIKSKPQMIENAVKKI